MHPETIKTLLKMSKPSRILEQLAQTRKLDKELANLIGVPQDKDHHPEGDAFIHTCMVLDEAVEISKRAVFDEFDNAVLRLAALLHDVGKATTTVVHEDGRITAYGHPEAGFSIAEEFMDRSRIQPVVIDHVLPLITNHMAYVGFYTPDITTRSIRRLITRIKPTTMQMLAYVIEADQNGRGGKRYKAGLPERMREILYISEHIDSVHRPEPLLSGDDIMQLTGLTPSKALGDVKKALYDAQLAGKFTTKHGAITFLQENIEIRFNK